MNKKVKCNDTIIKVMSLISFFQNYESKFILDSFIFHVSPMRFLRWLATIVAFPHSHMICYTCKYRLDFSGH